MLKNINNTTFILLLIFLLITIYVICRNNKNDPELIDFIENRLNENENQINIKIQDLELNIDSILESDMHTSNKIENLKGFLNQIITNQKRLQNEKLKNDLEIINSDDSSHWEWLDRRFPRTKADNKLSSSTDQAP